MRTLIDVNVCLIGGRRGGGGVRFLLKRFLLTGQEALLPPPLPPLLSVVHTFPQCLSPPAFSHYLSPPPRFLNPPAGGLGPAGLEWENWPVKRKNTEPVLTRGTVAGKHCKKNTENAAKILLKNIEKAAKKHWNPVKKNTQFQECEILQKNYC